MTTTRRTAVVFGGAGFIGSNLARHLLTETDANVRIYDDLSRPGVKNNLKWLEEVAGRSRRLEVVVGDVRDAQNVSRAVVDATEVYQLAAQVAVTTSLSDPRLDFEINVCGTFNVLEGVRRSGNKPFVLYTSTNKVYGDMPDRHAVKLPNRYAYAFDVQGVAEDQPLDFHSPYGCSKGAADQYVRDYARVYGIPAVVFRMSCIAGRQQYGNEDQGWIAHFLYSALRHRPLSIYGDGRQVRDVLNVLDLITAVEAARAHIDVTAGEIYNIGGGAKNTTSLLELLEDIETLTGTRPLYDLYSPRPGDQAIYVSDHSRFTRATSWKPVLSVQDTLEQIYEFWRENQAVIDALNAIPIDVLRPEPATSIAELGRTA